MKEQMPTQREYNKFSPEGAEMEAGMMRVKIDEIIKDDLGHEPTAEDYDKAWEAVEKIKELAEKEPEFDKIFLGIMQIGNQYFQKGTEVLVKILSLGKVKGAPSDFHLHMFDDATAQLEQLKKKAEKRGHKDVR